MVSKLMDTRAAPHTRSIDKQHLVPEIGVPQRAHHSSSWRTKNEPSFMYVCMYDIYMLYVGLSVYQHVRWVYAHKRGRGTGKRNERTSTTFTGYSYYYIITE